MGEVVQGDLGRSASERDVSYVHPALVGRNRAGTLAVPREGVLLPMETMAFFGEVQGRCGPCNAVACYYPERKQRVVTNVMVKVTTV
ncbi:MAG: hypothetical protein NZM42_07340 [Gemmatales bacterium]|nr:hypothetical protein [Gemmatales bacterium]MDW8221719.1 hypothetical protein [Gemmatales bacterium]